MCIFYFLLFFLLMYCHFSDQFKVSLMIVFTNNINCWLKLRGWFPHAWSNRLLKDWIDVVLTTSLGRLFQVFMHRLKKDFDCTPLIPSFAKFRMIWKPCFLFVLVFITRIVSNCCGIICMDVFVNYVIDNPPVF